MPYAGGVATPMGPIIVCPLAFEQQILRRAGVPGRILCFGPGSKGVARLGEALRDAPDGPVILAGVAGALDPTIRTGSAWTIEAVESGTGQQWRPTWPPGGAPTAEAATIATSAMVLCEVAAKREFALGRCAQLVDQEAEAFAKLATERNWMWGIARAVSDDAQSPLPPDVAMWVDEDGRTRLNRVLLWCARHPWRIGTLLSLQRKSKRALLALAVQLRAHLES